MKMKEINFSDYLKKYGILGLVVLWLNNRLTTVEERLETTQGLLYECYEDRIKHVSIENTNTVDNYPKKQYFTAFNIVGVLPKKENEA